VKTCIHLRAAPSQDPPEEDCGNDDGDRQRKGNPGKQTTIVEEIDLSRYVVLHDRLLWLICSDRLAWCLQDVCSSERPFGPCDRVVAGIDEFEIAFIGYPLMAFAVAAYAVLERIVADRQRRGNAICFSDN